jgi:hypothetical protein
VRPLHDRDAAPTVLTREPSIYFGGARPPIHHRARDMGMDDKKLLALAKKNAAASVKKPAVTPKYDSTLAPDPADVEQLKKFHNEMKKREF